MPIIAVIESYGTIGLCHHARRGIETIRDLHFQDALGEGVFRDPCGETFAHRALILIASMNGLDMGPIPLGFDCRNG